MKKNVDHDDLTVFFDGCSCPACVMAPVRRSGQLVDLRLVGYNKAFARLAGIKRGEKEGKLLSETAPEDFKALLRPTARALVAGKSRTAMLYIATISRWCRFTFASSESGNVIAFISVIEGEKKSRASLGSTSLFKGFFESGGIKLIIRASDRRILEGNEAACEFYGLSHGELKSLRIDQVDTSAIEVIARTMASINAQGLAIFHAFHRAAGGGERAVEVHSYVGQYEGETVHFAVILDRSDQNRIAASLEVPEAAERIRPAEERHFAPLMVRYGRELPFLKDLVRQVLPYGRLITYNKGEHFLEHGDINPNVGFLLKGILRQYTISPDGKDCTLKLMRPGDILYVDPWREREGSISLALEAMDECLVFIVRISHFGPLVDSDMRWSKLFYRTTMEALMTQLERDYSLLTEDASSRLRRFAEEDGDALPFLRAYHIASYLGISCETLSRIRRSKTGGGARP
jgi:PAS domain-containing protein/CRP-like cAMP-binding protein